MPPRNYIDFKLYLTAASDGKGACQVSLLPTPEVGEAITPINVAAENAPKADLLAFLASKQITLRNLAALGKQLADCLLPVGPIRDLFLDAYRRAGDDQGVRLRPIVADHALKQWPLLYSRLPDGALFPERIKQSGANPAAEAFRKVFTQTWTGIQEGTITGVTIGFIQNGVKIVQKVKGVRGKFTGIDAGAAGANANIVVEQEFETSGKGSEIIGAKFETL